MQNLKLNKSFYFFILPILLVTGLYSFKSPNNRYIHSNNYLGDTTAFSPDTAEGWGIYSSYLESQADSVDFELILFRNVPMGNNWSDSSVVGTIKNEYVPLEPRTIEYPEGLRIWRIIFQTDGKCLFQLISGPEPEGDPIIFPVITKYKM